MYLCEWTGLFCSLYLLRHVQSTLYAVGSRSECTSTIGVSTVLIEQKIHTESQYGEKNVISRKREGWSCGDGDMEFVKK